MTDYIANDRIRQAMERLDATIQRQQQNYSRQPRFGADPQEIMWSAFKWVKQAVLEEPEYDADSRERDDWLRDFWRQEPHLAGVLNSVVSIDQNRGWSITGGRNQVNRYNHILRAAEDGHGWRRYIGLQSLSYYTADIGAITETGRDGVEGPLRALYHVDPAKCRFTGKRNAPLRYDGTGEQSWTRWDYFSTTSMTSTDEDLHGLGWCAVSRCLELARIMVGVYQHELEKLGARAPRGLLLLQNIEQEQWNKAMQARDAELTGKMQEWYGAVSVLAQMGVEQIDAKLVALSQLPDNFDLEVWTNMLMYGYALSFGYDPIEFWPVSAGALGRGKETEIQHRKATGKGGANFMLGFQDQMQMQLPETALFEFEERDQQGMLLDAEVAAAWGEVTKSLYAAGMGPLSREEMRSLLAENGIIPPEWTEIEEEVEVGDEDSPENRSLKERLLEQDPVRRAIAQYPDEPIVRYQWPTGRTRVLWERGGDAIRRRWRVLKPEPRLLPLSERGNGHRIERQEDESEVLFQGEDFTITEADVDRAIDQGRRRVGDEFAELLEAEELESEEIEALDQLEE